MQVFTLFKTSRTHMFLACCLRDPERAPPVPVRTSGILSVRSQQNFLAKYGKRVTGAQSLPCFLEGGMVVFLQKW